MGAEELPVANGATFSSKEMLVRIDAKVDVIAGKQAHYDVELALLKARAEENTRRVTDVESRAVLAAEAASTAKDDVAAALAAREVVVDQKLQEVRDNQLSVRKVVTWMALVLGGLVVSADAIARFLSR